MAGALAQIDALDELLVEACPRCGAEGALLGERFYGPCAKCRAALRVGSPPPEPAKRTRTTRVAGVVRARKTAFVDAPGDGVPAHVMLDQLDDDTVRVYLVGARRWADRNELTEWATTPGGEWSSTSLYVRNLDAPVLRFERRGRAVEVMRAAAWFGDGGYSAPTAARAWSTLGELIGDTFEGAVPLSSPPGTGSLLFRRLVPAGGYPVLDDDAQTLIRTNLGQHRVEHFEHQGDTIDGLAEVDGRLMYAGVCWGMPVGEPVMGVGRPQPWPAMAKRPGFYRCRWSVPRDWSQLGLLGVRGPDGWRYPSTPGEACVGWITGAELDLAERCGWAIDVRQHFVWPKPDEHAPRPPLDVWAKRLVTLREERLRMLALAGDVDDELHAMLRAALRHVLIDTIGVFLAGPRTEVRVVDTPAGGDGIELPDGAQLLAPLDEDRWLIEVGVASRWREQMAHPEWSATIYGRTRARMLAGPAVNGVANGALHVPAGELLAVNGDALYCAAVPDWSRPASEGGADDGAPGRLRLKSWHPGPLRAPHTLRELLALRDGLAS